MTAILPLTASFSSTFKQGQTAVKHMTLAISLGLALPLLLPFIIGHFINPPRGVCTDIAILLNFGLGLALTLPYTVLFHKRDKKRGGRHLDRTGMIPNNAIEVGAMIGTMLWGMLTFWSIVELIVNLNR